MHQLDVLAVGVGVADENVERRRPYEPDKFGDRIGEAVEEGSDVGQ